MRSRIAICLAALCAAAAACSGAQAGAFRTLYSFCAQTDCADGQNPQVGVVLDAHGNLFGTTVYGGRGVPIPNHGVAFELSRAPGHAWTYQVLHVFCSEANCDDGGFPQGGVIGDAAGNIYGTANAGGAADDGTIFELARGSGGFTFAKLHDFSGADGITPSTGLRYAGYEAGQPWDGVSPLYGTTTGGGTHQEGTVFQLMPGPAWSPNTIFSFGQDATGNSAWASVTVVSPGNTVYGVTEAPNSGSVYQLTNSGGSGWAETTLYTFSSTTGDDTYFPYGGIAQDVSGALFGTANGGGPQCVIRKHKIRRCGGGLFKLTPGGPTWTFAAVHDFCAEDRHCKDGAGPMGSVLIDGSGNLYGTTQGGGGYPGNGTIYRVLPDGTFQVLHDFCRQPGCADGADPTGDLVMDSKGRLYGTTFGGGNDNSGVIYEFTP